MATLSQMSANSSNDQRVVSFIGQFSVLFGFAKVVIPVHAPPAKKSG